MQLGAGYIYARNEVMKKANRAIEENFCVLEVNSKERTIQKMSTSYYIHNLLPLQLVTRPHEQYPMRASQKERQSVQKAVNNAHMIQSSAFGVYKPVGSGFDMR